jgi:hypothetical protein
MSTISNVGPGWYSVDEFLVKQDPTHGYVCNCLDFKDFTTCKHVKDILTISYTGFLDRFNKGEIVNEDGKLDTERFNKAKDRYDKLMSIKVPEPAFLQEIPKFQETIFKVLSIPRGHAKKLWEEGISDSDQIIQHLF